MKGRKVSIFLLRFIGRKGIAEKEEKKTGWNKYTRKRKKRRKKKENRSQEKKKFPWKRY